MQTSSSKHGETTFYQDSSGQNPLPNPNSAFQRPAKMNVPIAAENVGPRESNLIQFHQHKPLVESTNSSSTKSTPDFSKSAHQKVKIHSDFLKQEESKRINRQPTPLPYNASFPVADRQISQVRQPEEKKADDITIDRPTSRSTPHSDNDGKLENMNLDERYENFFLFPQKMTSEQLEKND